MMPCRSATGRLVTTITMVFHTGVNNPVPRAMATRVTTIRITITTTRPTTMSRAALLRHLRHMPLSVKRHIVLITTTTVPQLLRPFITALHPAHLDNKDTVIPTGKYLLKIDHLEMLEWVYCYFQGDQSNQREVKS